MSTDGCTSPVRSGKSCIQRLAEGWITVCDLCPLCTWRFMAAMEWLDEPLSWHEAFVKRAEAPGVSSDV